LRSRARSTSTSRFDLSAAAIGSAVRCLSDARVRPVWRLRKLSLVTFNNNLHVARLTNCRSILLSTTANFQRRNWAIACRSPMRIGQHQRRSLESRHWRRQHHSLGSFDLRNKRGRPRSALLRARNCSRHAACRSPHSKSRHRATHSRHSSGCELVPAPRQASGRPTDAINPSSVRSFFPSRSDVYATGHDVVTPQC